jgi:hypothetical protein
MPLLHLTRLNERALTALMDRLLGAWAVDQAAKRLAAWGPGGTNLRRCGWSRGCAEAPVVRDFFILSAMLLLFVLVIGAGVLAMLMG